MMIKFAYQLLSSVIGIGKEGDELKKIAGDDSNYYQASNFTQLTSQQFRRTVTTGVCSHVIRNETSSKSAR